MTVPGCGVGECGSAMFLQRSQWVVGQKGQTRSPTPPTASTHTYVSLAHGMIEWDEGKRRAVGLGAARAMGYASHTHLKRDDTATTRVRWPRRAGRSTQAAAGSSGRMWRQRIEGAAATMQRSAPTAGHGRLMARASRAAVAMSRASTQAQVRAQRG